MKIKGDKMIHYYRGYTIWHDGKFWRLRDTSHSTLKEAKCEADIIVAKIINKCPLLKTVMEAK